MDFLSDRIANLDSPISFAPAEDTLRNAQRVQALEDDVKALRLQASRNDALVQGLRAQLAQAQSERTPAVLLYTMGVLLVFCLAAVALLWARLRQVQQGAQAWWQGQSEHVDVGAIPDTQPGLTAEESRLSTLSPGPMPHGDSPAFPPIKPAGPVAAPLPHRLPPASALSEFLADMPVTGAAAGYSVTEMHDSSFDDMLAGNVRRRVVPSHGLAGRLNSDAERDVRQQAEFFLSLGQTGRAVQVLQKEVDESAEVGPHIFLDLLALYHSLGQRAPFDALRGRFAREFAGRVPEFAAFRDEGRALDAYPEVLARITASWGTASGRPVLEACIFRDAAMPVNFDLLAFRELLLLHAVSTELAGGSAVTPEPLPVPGAVDLDLSERGVAQDGEDVDLPLPMLPPVDADTAPVPAAIAPGGNLLDFNLPPSQPKT